MTKADVLRLTSQEKLEEVYKLLILKQFEGFPDADHPIFIRGVFAGMEALAESIAQSVGDRKLLTVDAPLE